jgi:predicted phage terminase large subunit-like protein
VARTSNPAYAELCAREILRGADAVLDAVQRLTPKHERPEHMRPVADFFAAVARGEAARLVLSSAPRFAKTTTIEHAVAWLMFVKPGVKVVVVCCTATLAEQISRRIRSLVERLGIIIPRDQRAVDAWETSSGSSLRAIGAGGALVGVGADVLVCDDLIPSMEAAQSQTQREQIEEWFETTALGRLEPGGSCLVCMHRYSPDDISGRLIDRGWPSANVPALNAAGESSWPTRSSTDALRERQQEVGPIAFSALYQGTPRPRGGSVFSREPVFYDPVELRRALVAGYGRLAIGVDPAATARTSADYSCILVAAFLEEEQRAPVPAQPGQRASTRLEYRTVMHVLDVVRAQVEVPVLVDRIAEEQRRWRAVVGVESVGGFKSVGQYLRRANPTLTVYEIKRTTDKLTASIEASAWWARGDIRLPPSAPWLDAFVREVMAFTGTGKDRNDDQVDAMTLCLTLRNLGVAAARRARQRAQLSAITGWPFC